MISLSSLGIKKRDDLYIFENQNILTFVNKDVIIKVEALDKPKLIFWSELHFFKMYINHYLQIFKSLEIYK